MCINSACKNIRNPSIGSAVAVAWLGAALWGLGTPPLPGRLAVPAGGMGVVGRGRGAATSSLSLARPSPRGSACGCPSDLQPAKYFPHEGDARGTVPTTETRVPFSCPSGAPRSREDTVPRCCGRTCCCQARDPSSSPRPWLLTGGGVFLERQPLEVDVSFQHGATSCQVRCAGAHGVQERGDFVFVRSKGQGQRAQLGKGRDSAPPPQTQDAQLCSWGAKLGCPGARLATPPPQLFGLGGPKPASCPPQDTCGHRPRPAPSSATPHSQSPDTDTERGASERPPGTLGTNSRALPGLPPASPPRARLHRPRRASYQSGWLVGPQGRLPAGEGG